MKLLEVRLAYRSTNASWGGMEENDFTLPIKVLDGEGSVLREDCISDKKPALVLLPSDIDIAFVRLTWPSGKTQTQRANLGEQDSLQITFNDKDIAQNEWATWAIPRLNPNTMHTDTSSDTGIEQYNRVWLRLWQYTDQQWKDTPIQPVAQHANDFARQIDLNLGKTSWLLQIGGLQVPWRLVSLPGGGKCRVLLTPTDSNDPRTDPLKVIVTSFRTDAEILLEFLARDALSTAKSLSTSLYSPEYVALGLLTQKIEDPIAAIAGAYFLLRTYRWERIDADWLVHLHRAFPWLPDAALIRCIVETRAGLKDKQSELAALNLLKDSFNRGLPIYAEGMALLKEAAGVLKACSQTTWREAALFERIERLGSASTWAGSAFCFYGKDPEMPTPAKLIGIPEKTRIPAPPRPQQQQQQQQQQAFYVQEEDLVIDPQVTFLEDIQEPAYTQTQGHSGYMDMD